MRLSFQARAMPSGPRLQLRRGWRPNSREDSVEAVCPLRGASHPEEKKEEEAVPTAGQRLVCRSQPLALLWGSCTQTCFRPTSPGDTVPLESGLERRWTGGAQGDWEGQGEKACREGHPGKLADRQTGDKTFRSAHRS